MAQKDELYHWGVPGMRWGHRKAVESNSGNTSGKGKSKTTTKVEPTTAKPKMSKGKKIAIGTAAAGVALAGIGALVVTAKNPKYKQMAVNAINKLLRKK